MRTHLLEERMSKVEFVSSGGYCDFKAIQVLRNAIAGIRTSVTMVSGCPISRKTHYITLEWSLEILV